MAEGRKNISFVHGGCCRITYCSILCSFAHRVFRLSSNRKMYSSSRTQHQPTSSSSRTSGLYFLLPLKFAPRIEIVVPGQRVCTRQYVSVSTSNSRSLSFSLSDWNTEETWVVSNFAGKRDVGCSLSCWILQMYDTDGALKQ